MTLIKNEYPILDYDTNKISIIKAERYGYHFPEKAVLAFLGDEVDQFAAEKSAEVIVRYETMTTSYPVYRIYFENEEITLVRAPVGASPAAQVLEFLIGAGVKKVIAIGSCGTLVDLPENNWLITESALRDEGTSYHYLEGQRFIDLDKNVIAKIQEMFSERGFESETCKTWTTDGFYRETEDLVAYRIAEGCQVVEMECAALAAVSEFRQINFGQILFTADTLANAKQYDSREFGKDSIKMGLRLALAAVSKL